MSKVIIALSVLVLAAYVTGVPLKSKDVTITLDEVHPGTTILDSNGNKKVVKSVVLPPDDGYSNWGDEVYKQRADEDVLLLRDLVIYPKTSNKDQNLHYTAQFSNVNQITSVRLVNVGRERAYGGEIDVSSDSVDVYFTLPAQRDPRVLIEVYGYED